MTLTPPAMRLTPLPSPLADRVLTHLDKWPSDWITLNRTQRAAIRAAIETEMKAQLGDS